MNRKGSFKCSPIVFDAGSLNQLLPCIAGYRVSCILCSSEQLTPFWGFPLGWDSPSDMCYLMNQWITYNLPIDLLDGQVVSKAIYSTSFYICLLAANVKNLQHIQNTL